MEQASLICDITHLNLYYIYVAIALQVQMQKRSRFSIKYNCSQNNNAFYAQLITVKQKRSHVFQLTEKHFNVFQSVLRY